MPSILIIDDDGLEELEFIGWEVEAIDSMAWRIIHHQEPLAISSHIDCPNISTKSSQVTCKVEISAIFEIKIDDASLIAHHYHFLISGDISWTNIW